jgi:hypothetical protein
MARATKSADHVGMANNVLLCEHCGARQELTLPQPVESAAALMIAWGKAHQKCRPIPGVSAFRQAESLDRWPVSDDTGLSSRAIYEHMRYGGARKADHPWDPSDFGRCYRLLALAPDWRARIGEMATYGKVWARLAAAWDELTALYEAEVDTSALPHRAKAKNGMAPRLYERMKDVIDGRDLTQTVMTLSERREGVSEKA